MEPPPTIGVGCRIIAEFEDDASAVTTAEPEFVPVNALPFPVILVPARANSPLTLFPPSEEATTARTSWLRIVQRFTEPVPENEGRLRVLGSEGPRHPSLSIGLRGRTNGEKPCAYVGTEVDVTDKQILLLFHKVGDESNEPRWRTTAIPWTEISNIQFEGDRAVEPKQQ